ncbi:hypothetical protein SLEP1_g25501 [Rubroshorea leprosula]|uniref:Uncharacterized protein n=1 Tax=Rubroshorea leprosula TaxID=152421 RepID=A0AAV5JPK4_9ROSI|nr:hypothetical protein SLEP1_g25501 [Rubroshorea leprosula]
MVQLTFFECGGLATLETLVRWQAPTEPQMNNIASVGWVGSLLDNLVTFFDTNSGDGIEAWINLKDEDTAKK